MSPDSPDQGRARPRGARCWPLALIAVCAAVAFVVLRLANEGDRQQANTAGALVLLLAAGLSVLHVLFFSRLSTRARMSAVAGVASLIAAFFTLVRVVGVTGDLLPILEWRWRATPRPDHRASPSRASPDTALPAPGLADFPQFFGPRRDGKLDGPQLVRDWAAQPPRQLWRRRVGEAWSGFAVRGRRAVTQEQYGEEEAVVCYDVASGDRLWEHRDTARYATTLGGVGPRATPTIEANRVFVQGATGVLTCLELATGEPVWSRNILQDNNAALPEWGIAGSPLVVGEAVVVSAGGPGGRSLVAYAKKTGEALWRNGSDATHWSSPVHATLAGVEQVLMFTATRVEAYAVRSGKILWSYPWKAGHPHVCMPVAMAPDRVLISSGYGTGCHLVRIDRRGDALAATRVWRSLALKAKFTNVIEKDGFVYGLDDGALACVDLATGRRRWKGKRSGHGQVLLVGELLLVTSEHGEVVLTEPTPAEYRELGRFTAFDRKSWNPPALAGCYLLVRNDREAACYRLATVE